MGRAAATLAALTFVLPFAALSVSEAHALDQPTTPQPVADYFAEGLIPRLIDLYGSGNVSGDGVDFDATTKVGSISRVREWTPDFLAGRVSDDPTRLTNDWVAPVTLRGDVLGLATVWINPADDEPELASFDSAAFAREIAKAPQDSWIVHDSQRDAWFALTEDGLFPLIAGTSGLSQPTTPAAYQRLISASSPDVVESPSGVTIAALVLGIVVVGVAIFVLLPVKRKGSTDDEHDDDEHDDSKHDAHERDDLERADVELGDADEEAESEAESELDPVLEPAAEKPPAAQPAVKKPEESKPAAKKAAALKTAAKKTATTKTPATKTPATKTAAKKPAAKKPVTDEPATD